ncbi:MAG: phage tail protein [Gaiellaceae bacterium]
MVARTSSIALTAVRAAAQSAARFSLSIDGVELARFSELAEITSRTVVLNRGISASRELSTWHQSVVEGQIAAHKDATLVLYDTGGTPVARYNLESAWPSKVESSGLKAGASEVQYESITLCHEGFEIQ